MLRVGNAAWDGGRPLNAALNEQLEKLLASGHRCVRIVTTEEDEALYAAHNSAMGLGAKMLVWTAVHGVYNGLVEGAKPEPATENPAAALFHFWRQRESTVCVALDLSVHLMKDERVLRAWRDLLLALDRTNSWLVMIDHDEGVPEIVRAHSTRLEPALPEEEDLVGVIKSTLRDVHRRTPIEASIAEADLEAIVKNLRGLTRRQARQVIRDCVTDDRKLSITDLPKVLLAKRRSIEATGVLEFVESPTSLDEIGGMATLKGWLKRREVGLRSDAKKHGLTPPRGVLLLGVQGSGKSLCAKAVATAWNRPLLRLDAGALYDRYVGESERKLRDALKQAEMMAPVVLWIDEIEKAFASAASTSSDGGLSRRMFGALLTWMQEHRNPVFLAATANDIAALPPELLRKGRFDEIFFVDLPGMEARAAIFAIHLRKRGRAPGDVDVAKLAAACEGFSGAEIEQAIVSAIHDCFSDDVPLSTETILRVIQSSPPLSVTMRERMDELRAWSKGRCVPAD